MVNDIDVCAGVLLFSKVNMMFLGYSHPLSIIVLKIKKYIFEVTELMFRLKQKHWCADCFHCL